MRLELLLGLLQLAITRLTIGRVYSWLTAIAATNTISVNILLTGFLTRLRRVLLKEVLLRGSTLCILQAGGWDRPSWTRHLLLLNLGSRSHKCTRIDSLRRAATRLSRVTAHGTAAIAISVVKHSLASSLLSDEGPNLNYYSSSLKLMNFV